MINLFRRRKKYIEESVDVNDTETEEFPKKLGDLVRTSHSFYRFSQSTPG